MPFELILIKLDVGEHGLLKNNDLTDMQEIWLDYQPNSLAYPLMSERLKLVIEKNLTGNEHIDWISFKIKHGDEERQYFILRFNKLLDVLNIQKTMFVQGTDHIIKPVFDISKINAYTIFTKPSSYNLWKITPALYINDVLKKIIQKEKLTGLDFTKTSIS